MNLSEGEVLVLYLGNICIVTQVFSMSYFIYFSLMRNIHTKILFHFVIILM